MAGRPKSGAQHKSGARWAAWLNRHLSLRDWRPADLIRAAGRDSEGKPVLSSGRVSQWVNGKEGASPEYAIIVARALGVPDSEALRATAAIDDADGPDEQAPAERDSSSADDDEAFINRLRSSPDPEKRKLADRFEQDLQRARRVARLELDDLERRRSGEAGPDTDVDISA